MKVTFLTALALVGGTCCSQAFGQTQNALAEFEFAFLGDMPYNDVRVPDLDREPLFLNLVADINQDPRVQFVMHAGDIKGGHEPCSDALIAHRFSLYQKFKVPFIYTPGDNEWTDCHRQDNLNLNPLDRLAFVRSTFFPDPDYSTGGKKIPVVSQTHVSGYAAFVENVWFKRNNVIFATIHVVGSDNDLDPWTGGDDKFDDSAAALSLAHQNEYKTRNLADIEWLDEVFDAAESAQGLFLVMQADPAIEDFDPAAMPPDPNGPPPPAAQGFDDFLAKLYTKAKAYGKPVVLAHGDSHVLLIDKPFDEESPDKYNPAVMNFTRVQGFGQANIHWIKVYVDPKSDDVFKFEPRIVKANLP